MKTKLYCQNYNVFLGVPFYWTGGDRFLQCPTKGSHNMRRNNNSSHQTRDPRPETPDSGFRPASSPSSYRILSSIGTKTEFCFAVLRFDFSQAPYLYLSICVSVMVMVLVLLRMYLLDTLRIQMHWLCRHRNSFSDLGPGTVLIGPRFPFPFHRMAHHFSVAPSVGIVCIFKVDLPPLVALMSSAEFRHASELHIPTMSISAVYLMWSNERALILQSGAK